MKANYFKKRDIKTIIISLIVLCIVLSIVLGLVCLNLMNISYNQDKCSYEAIEKISYYSKQAGCARGCNIANTNDIL